MKKGRLDISGLFSYESWLLLCFLLGTAAGTAAVLAFGQELAAGAVIGEVYGSAGAGGAYGAAKTGTPERILERIRLRSVSLGCGWLVGLTVCSRLLYGILTFYGGLCLGAALSLLTVRKGLMGLPAFLRLMVPQIAVYGFVWYVLALWAGQRQKRMHLAGVALLAVLTALGAWLECL